MGKHKHEHEHKHLQQMVKLAVQEVVRQHEEERAERTSRETWRTGMRVLRAEVGGAARGLP